MANKLNREEVLLQYIQPGVLGWSDGTISTIAPIVTIALVTGNPWFAFLAGLSTTLGAALSMGVSEALSDDGELTGRGKPWRRGAITGGGTFFGGIFHTLPFLIPALTVAFGLSIFVLIAELLLLAFVRYRFFPNVTFTGSLKEVGISGILVITVGILLGGVH